MPARPSKTRASRPKPSGRFGRRSLELRRPSPREKRLFADDRGAVAAYEAEEVLASRDRHVEYLVRARLL